MVEKFHLYHVVVLLYRSKENVYARFKSGAFLRGHFVTSPTKHNGNIQHVNCRNIYGREVTFLFILAWNIILLDQTKAKNKPEDQDGLKSLT